MRIKRTITISLLLIIAISVFLFSKISKSRKLYSTDKQYSIYTKNYVYSEIACALFSTFDCSYSGRIYLFDELENKIIGSIFTKNVQAAESVSWSIYNNTILFKDSETVLPEGAFLLPRPLKKTINKP